jgi:uncharacterized membrane protein (UPF0127 family)
LNSLFFSARPHGRFPARAQRPSAPFRRALARAGAALSVAIALTLGASGMAMAQPIAPTAATIKQPGDFPVVTLSIGLNVIHAEVAANQADREQGLMYRKSLAPNSGMLFVFDERAGHCFWMKNTLIPLSIAFIDDDGSITDIDEMQAETENNHCPTRAGRYALEMDKGWFTQHGIKPGMKIARGDGAPAKSP